MNATERLAVATELVVEELRRVRRERERERTVSREAVAERQAARWVHEVTEPGVRARAYLQIPGFAERFERVVPTSAWNGGPTWAVVTCPCGEAPDLERGVPTPCECGRAFLFTGESVRVAFSPSEGSS